MGEGATRVGDERSPEDLEREIDSLRANLTGIAGELDRRRHELTRGRRGTLLVLAGGALLVIGGKLALNARHRKRNGSIEDGAPGDRTRPNREEPGVGKRMLTTAASAAAAMVVSRVVERAIARRSSA